MGLTYFTFLNYNNQGAAQDFEFPAKSEQELAQNSSEKTTHLAEDSVAVVCVQDNKDATSSTNYQDKNTADFSCTMIRTIISKTPFSSKHQYDQIEEEPSNWEEPSAELQDALSSVSDPDFLKSDEDASAELQDFLKSDEDASAELQDALSSASEPDLLKSKKALMH